MASTIGQITVGTSAVRLTSVAALGSGANSTINDSPIRRGIRWSFDPATDAKIYVGGVGVTISTGQLLGSVDQTAPADFAKLGDVYLISDTADQAVSYNIVEQVFS